MTKAEEQRIEYVPLDEVIRWPRNPKSHDPPELIASFKRFGFVAPLIFDEASGRMVAGHGRLEALQELMRDGKAPPKRVKKKRGKGGAWLVPVVRGIHFESETEAEAYVVADNKLQEAGGWQGPWDRVGRREPAHRLYVSGGLREN